MTRVTCSITKYTNIDFKSFYVGHFLSLCGIFFSAIQISTGYTTFLFFNSIPINNSPPFRWTVVCMLWDSGALGDLEREVQTFCLFQRYTSVWKVSVTSRNISSLVEEWCASQPSAWRALPRLSWLRGRDWVAWSKALLGPVESPFIAQLHSPNGNQSGSRKIYPSSS